VAIALDTPVQYVKGVGPTRAGQLAELGVHTVEDLLTYFPRRFDLRRQVQPIGVLRGTEETATVAGEVLDVREQVYRRPPSFQCNLNDGTGSVLVKWFHGLYLRDKIKVGMQIAVSGRVSLYREQVQFLNPSFQVIWDPQATNLDQDELLPVYPAGGGLASGVIAQVIRRVLPDVIDLVDEWFDADFLRRRELMGRREAIAAMHKPEDRQQWAGARRRLAYEECLLMQVGVALLRMREISRPAHPLALSDEIDRRIRARFPFELTGAQDQAVREIAADMARPRPMNRLLQGDVGSGKTVVALYAALLAVAHRKQAAIMAPTEILAQQHYQKVCAYLAGSRVRVALLTGSQKPAQRQAALSSLAGGETDLVVGTHALLSQGVRFSQLGLVVVDEQHKFGVRQRSGIRGKGFAPHYLVMTATPIPRTLALTVFGDLDVSTIASLPPGRGKTTTRIVPQQQMPMVLARVKQELKRGQQAYFIYPLVRESPELELTAAQEAYEELRRSELAAWGVGLIHGQLPAAEKETVMRAFGEGRLGVLAASSVVEVGLDMPKASVIVVLHAERFGLAQLHQLRGRVGRSSEDALCVLVSSTDNPLARRRLEVMAGTSDGFKIAEEDLRIRGPGEFFGTRQHGLPELRLADLVEDYDLLRMARRDAMEIVQGDPGLNAPHNQHLREQVIKAYAGRLELLGGA